MKDIPIIFELVIVGFEVLAWILLLVLTLFGYHWIELNFVTQWATQLSFGLVGLAYMFGTLGDGAGQVLNGPDTNVDFVRECLVDRTATSDLH